MLKHLITLSLFLVTFSAFAQTKVLIVPFESKMYRSSLDRDIAAKEEKSFAEIQETFRAGVVMNIDLEAKKSTEIVDLIRLDSAKQFEDLQYIYSSIGYEYVPIVTEEPSSAEVTEDKPSSAKASEDKGLKIGKLKGKLAGIGQKPSSAKATEGDRGDVVAKSDNRPKYMKTKVKNAELWAFLKEEYNVDAVVFINELDLSYDASPEAYAVGTSEAKVKIVIHYTGFDMSGNELGSGAASGYFTKHYKNQREIIQIHMQEAARIVVRSVGI